MAILGVQVRVVAGLIALPTVFGLAGIGCAERNRGTGHPELSAARQVVVVAPVLNLSGTPDLDPLKLTDSLASEFLSFSTVSVVPVNLTLAALAQRGQAWIETPEDAIELAREFGADATVVTAVTEFQPYEPPVVGLIMQWYAVPKHDELSPFDPVTASRQAASPAAVELAAAAESVPRFQIQRVFNAAHDAVLDEIREFARTRDGHQSPHGWRKYTKSQELYVRYCCWAMIRSMLRLNDSQRTLAEPHEVKP